MSETKNITENQLKRTMKSRHLFMISLGGVIGTGLFLSSGYTINQAGPVGTLLAYLIGSVIVYLVMLCLGELVVKMPVTGSFHTYATKFIGPGTGFTMAWLYWLTWTVALGSEFTAAGLIMEGWFPSISVWEWSAFFVVLLFALNAFSVRFFAETEFWFSSIKVIAIILFILIGGLAVFGIIPMSGTSEAPLFTNFVKDGLFPTGFGAVFLTMLAVNFAFSGTELIGVASGETANPEKVIPKTIHTTLIRLIIFFMGSITVISALIPWKEAGVDQSPFVLVFNSIGIPYAGTIMNFVVLTAILSCANSGLYAATRMLWSLSNEKMISGVFGKVNKKGVPMPALILTALGGVLSLISSVIPAQQVYIILVSISGLAVVIVWMGIAASQFMFRRAYLKAGNAVNDLKFKTPLYPIVPIAAFLLCFLSCVLIVFDPAQRAALFYTIPFVALCYICYYVKQSIQKKKTGIQEEVKDVKEVRV
ncbi:amino acid permease [Paenibacillus sp. 7124]|uniref:Amino acid permease n=1 Tax=Paenibacillus apii TaxID=1850370 RepID=A0A6M1PF80_9BACL|nr:amino acid permease [Paenibacillus apii]NGM82049.1 amino acid permease [Paenibacillus apii]